MRVGVRVGATTVMFVAMLLAFIQPALGHAAYSDSDPGHEETVSSPPSEVWAEFTEPPAPGSTLKIYDECRTKVDNGDSRIEGFRIYITMSSSSSGTFDVDYRVTSAYDTHVTTGDFTFVSSGGDDCAGGDDAPGGSGGSDGSDGSGGGDGGGSGTDNGGGSGNDGAGSGSNAADGGAGGDNGDRSGGGGGGRGADDESDDAGGGAGPTLARDRDRPEKGLMDGIEWGEFAFALAIAAVIGGAGGKVYAGIVGPRR